MIEYLLELSEHEGIAVRAAHLPRIGDIIDVMKDYEPRHRFKLRVTEVQHDLIVEDTPRDGVRGHGETLPQVRGEIIARRINSVWVETEPS